MTAGARHATASVGLVATAAELPAGWLPARDIAARAGLPEWVVVEKMGLRGKHVAGPDEHVSDLAASVGRVLLDEAGVPAGDLDAVVYFGSTFKDFPVWQAAPRIAHLLGAANAFALELDYVSCGAPVALRVARALMLTEPRLRTVLLVGAARESTLVDYTNPRARFMYTFGDGAAAALLVRGAASGEVLGSHMVTDGSLAMHVRVPAGGSVEPASPASVAAGRHRLDVEDLAAMKARLDAVSLDNFVAVAEAALAESGAKLADVDYVCGTHVKPSMHAALLDRLGVPAERAASLDDTGHMSGIDPLVGYDRARRSGAVVDGDLVLMLAAGTGYTWAATVVRAGNHSTGRGDR